MRHQCGRLRFVTAVLIGLFSLGLSVQALQSNSGGAAPNRKKSASQTAKGPQKTGDPDLAGLQEALKNPELMKELGKLIEKVQKGMQYPAARTESGILAKLPESTVFYAAFSNYGESAHQAALIFKDELDQSPQLKAFLAKNQLDTLEPQVQSGIQKFYEFSQFLGDEVVIAGRLQGNEPRGVIAAEIKKPGLRAFLDKLNEEVFAKSGDPLRIFDQGQLAAAADKGKSSAPVVLVRPDFVAIGLSVEALREFNSQVEKSGPGLSSSDLGRRLAQSYHDGATTVLGLNLHKLVGLIPLTKPQDRALFEKTGLAEVSYLVAENTLSAAGSTNRFELAFRGPRHGVASWIASPAPMDGLDFVSSHPAIVLAMNLKSPAQIFDDLKDMLGEPAFASLSQMEAQLNVNLKQDVLGKLTGEIVVEMQSPPIPMTGTAQTAFAGVAAAPPKPPSFKVILRVTDSAGLQQTLAKLLATAPLQRGQREEDGVTINTLTPPGGNDSLEINYFFLDNYLVVASDRALAKEALTAHRSGNSLAKSRRLLDALAPGQSLNTSFLTYQDVGMMLGSMAAQLPPEMRSLMPFGPGMEVKPTVVSITADESAFHGMTNSSAQADATFALVTAAIAIPNLLRSRVAANEAAAAAGLRVLNTAQVTYASTYPDKGFASSLAALGSGAGTSEDKNPSAEHACLVDDALGNATCTAGKWCDKNGYRFAVRPVCLQGRCMKYVVTATPADVNSGGKSFCSTDDAVIRSHAGAPLATALTAAECRAWKPIE